MTAAKRGGLPASPIDEFSDREILLSGRFDERLKQLAAAKAEAMPYLKIADTIDRANEILADSDAKVLKANADLDARAKALADRGAELTLLAASLREREQKLDNDRNAFAAEVSDYQRAENDRSKAWDSAESRRETEENATRSKLAQDRAALDKALQKFSAEQSTFYDYKAKDSASLARRTEDLVTAQELHAKRVADFEKEMRAERIEVDGLKRDLQARLDTGKSKV